LHDLRPEDRWGYQTEPEPNVNGCIPWPTPVHVALRPETIRLVPERQGDAIAGEVVKTTYLGSHVEYTVSTADGDLFVIDQDVERALPPGTAVSVIPAARGITLVRD
jgi:iron(III) transport system ATP-binding protein